MNPPNSRNTLLVSNLPSRVTVDALIGHFCQWGQVGRVFLAGSAESAFAADQLSAAAPYAALVVFTDPTSVDAALQSPGPHSLADRRYRIERYYCPEAPASPVDGSPQSQIVSLRVRCGQLQVENQQLASLIPAKDKATRLLMGNVEAWRQKLAWVEKKRAEDLQRLQLAVVERQHSVDQLSAAAAGLRQQLDEQRAVDLATNARVRWQALLERENAALLAVMHAKSKDPAPMQQLIATLNSARQEMCNQEAENSRLTQQLNQWDAQFRKLTEHLEEAKKALSRLALEGGGQQQQLIQSLTAERDRLRAELLEAVAGSGDSGGIAEAQAAGTAEAASTEELDDASLEKENKMVESGAEKVTEAGGDNASVGDDEVDNKSDGYDKNKDQDDVAAENNDEAPISPTAERAPLGSLAPAQQVQ